MTTRTLPGPKYLEIQGCKSPCNLQILVQFDRHGFLGPMFFIADSIFALL